MKSTVIGMFALLSLAAPPVLMAGDTQHPCDFILERIKAKDSNYSNTDFQQCLNRFPNYKEKYDRQVREEDERRRNSDREAQEARNEREKKIIVRISGDALSSSEFNFLKLPIVAKKVTYKNNGMLDDEKTVTSPDDACKYLGFEKAIEGSAIIGAENYSKDRFGAEKNQSALIIDKAWLLGSKQQKVAQLYSRSNNRYVLYDDKNGAYYLYKSITCERDRKKNEPIQTEVREAGEVLADHPEVRTTAVDDSRRHNRTPSEIYVGGDTSGRDFFRPNFDTSK
ncbi:MAG: hypothetical protein Fur0010_22820 [Bdellovibrio sp.]